MESSAYMEWIMSHQENDCRMSRTDQDHIQIESAWADGFVSIYHLEMDVAELKLVRKKDRENIFFLHFELHDEAHAKELFLEMISTLRKAGKKQSLKVLLSCTSGLTTSFFAGKLQEAAKTLSLDYSFQAVPLAKLYQEGFDSDVILIAPQIAYEYQKIQEIFHEKTVLKIPAAMFASYDTGSVIDLVRKERAERKVRKEEKAVYKVMRDIDNNFTIFVINMTREMESTKYHYRLYEKGVPVFSETAVRANNSLKDILDILDTQLSVLKMTYRIDAVSVAAPGILQEGKAIKRVDYDHIATEVKKRYGLPAYVSNNTDAVVLGYYAQQEKYDIITYHSQPVASLSGGQGIIYEGKLISGAHHMGGEIEAVFKRAYEGRIESVTLSLDEIKESMINYLIANIAVIDPQVILIRNRLTPNMEEIRKMLKKYIPEKSLPDLIYLRDVSEYASLGAMLYGLRKYKKEAAQAVKEKI